MKFLYHEAALLDAWKVAEWAALFTDDGEYMIPPTDDPHADPKKTLFLVYDEGETTIAWPSAASA